MVALRVHEVSLVTHVACVQAVVDHVKAGGEAELKSLLEPVPGAALLVARHAPAGAHRVAEQAARLPK